MLYVVISAGAIPLNNAYYGRGTGGIKINFIPCTGDEEFLANCTSNGVGFKLSFCNHNARVQCPGKFIP